MQDPLKPGQLVRYLETQARWFFARVRRVHSTGVELSFFDDSRPEVVSESQVETLDLFFLLRSRKLSLTRSRLTVHFYRKEYSRLPGSLIRRMQSALRRAGVCFSPSDWPSASTRIQLWPDDCSVDRETVAPELEALLPQWLEPFTLPSASRDPLGLQAPAEKLVNEVLPGLTVFTFRAGYYGFLTWAIRTVNELPRDSVPRLMSRREVLNSFERALALCEFVYHGKEDDSCRLIGQRSKSRVLGEREGDRYRVPDSILKNQNSAGSFRLFTTSLLSLGLVEEAGELAEDGLLPFNLTALGNDLANVFQSRVDSSFVGFALGKSRQSRGTLHDWGRSMCFSLFACSAAYRKRLLTGLFLGSSRDTEKRYRTVASLFAHGLIRLDDEAAIPRDHLTEEDAAILEDDVEGAGISNIDVMLHFYECPPRKELHALQALSVFELLSLGLTAVFRAAVESITTAGKADLDGVARSVASVDGLAPLWQSPMRETRPKTVKKLFNQLLECENATMAASIGGLLLLRVLRDPLLAAVWDILDEMVPEPLGLVDRWLRQRMDHSLAAALPDLLRALIDHHEMVSRRKNRQRWLFIEDKTLVRDDPQTMRQGLHSLRFPQLGSIARDIDLTEEDLRND